jgi:hypothetical protein
MLDCPDEHLAKIRKWQRDRDDVAAALRCLRNERHWALMWSGMTREWMMMQVVRPIIHGNKPVQFSMKKAKSHGGGPKGLACAVLLSCVVDVARHYDSRVGSDSVAA